MTWAHGRIGIPEGDGAYEALLRDTSDLLLSLVLPLPDHRGLADRSIRSWAVEQTLPRDRYDVIVVTDGSTPIVEAQVSALLRPNDRMLSVAPGTEAHFYVAGAREARGRWIFFSEAHVLGAPDCLEQVVRALLATGDVRRWHAEVWGSRGTRLDAARSGSSSECLGLRLAPDHWSRLFLRGSAVSRQAFQDVGGLNPEYGLFAEPDLAARLHAGGYRLGYAPDALVRHLNTSNTAELREAIHSYISGECAYRLEHPDGEGDAYFGTPDWWLRRARLDPDVDRTLWLGLGRSLLRAGPERRRRAKRWLALLPFAVLGRRAHSWKAALRTVGAELRCWWWRKHDERMLPAFQELYASLAEQTAIHALASADDPLEVRGSTCASAYGLADLPAAWTTGFHLIEEYAGERFRWSGPVASVKLPLDANARVLRLRTHGLRPRPRLQAFLNGRRLAIHDCQAEHGEIRLLLGRRHFTPRPFQYLVIVCDPLRPWLQGVPDRRELGIPLFSIAWDKAREDYEPGLRPRAARRSSTKRRTSPATSRARSESAASYASAGTPPGSVVG